MNRPPQKMNTEGIRQSIRLSYFNAAIWSLGNGLTSSMLIFYLALELMSKESTNQWWVISLLLAAQHLLGIFRWLAPTMLAKIPSRKAFCVVCFMISALLLLFIPVIAKPEFLPTLRDSMIAMVVLWCVYHLFQYLAVIAFWSWMDDIVPKKVRGRFIGRRERWLLVGSIVGMLVAGLFVMQWREYYKSEREMFWVGYAIAAAVGAVMMLFAVVPLAMMKSITNTNNHVSVAETLAKIFSPLADQRFRRLLYFGCCFSLFNGISQLAQNIYHWKVLGVLLLVLLSYKTYMRLGQTALSAWVGKCVDRFGNRPIMLISQFLVALGPLFYYFATPERPWILLGAWTVWIAYVGLNITLPSIMLKLSPEGANKTSYISTYFAITGLFYGLSTILGGFLYHFLETNETCQDFFRNSTLIPSHFDAIFLLGWICRSLAIILLLRIIEPGALRWREILKLRSK